MPALSHGTPGFQGHDDPLAAFGHSTVLGIVWDRLAFNDFPRAAPGFSYNLRFTLEMSHELDGSIAND